MTDRWYTNQISEKYSTTTKKIINSIQITNDAHPYKNLE